MAARGDRGAVRAAGAHGGVAASRCRGSTHSMKSEWRVLQPLTGLQNSHGMNSTHPILHGGHRPRCSRLHSCSSASADVTLW